MNTILNALVSLMSNPTTSGVLLAALIGSNVFMVSEKNELERSNRAIEQQLSAVTAQLQILVDAEAHALAREKSEKAAGQDNWKKEKDFLDMMKKRFDEKGGWRVPRE